MGLDLTRALAKREVFYGQHFRQEYTRPALLPEQLRHQTTQRHRTHVFSTRLLTAPVQHSRH